jgi:uncharacterized protein (UPF0335 family)
MSKEEKMKKSSSEAELGHNYNLSSEQKKSLRGFVLEIDRIEEQLQLYNEERSEIYKAAKEHGFNTRALRYMVKVNRMAAADREVYEQAVDAYRDALGDFASTPLGFAMMPTKEKP